MKDCTNNGCQCTPNQSINCTVNNCAHHCQDSNYCGLSSIRVGEAYDAGQFQSVITAFYDQVGQALQAQYPEVRLSIATTGAVLESGSDATSGQSLSGLAARAQRVWADLGETTREQALAALSAAGYADPAAALVVQTDQAGAAGESWALSMP